MRKFLLDFKSKTVRDAKAAYRDGQVTDLYCENPGERYHATVQDDLPYTVSLAFDSIRGWQGICSCDNEEYCKHIYAAALGLLAEVRLATSQAFVVTEPKTTSKTPLTPLALFSTALADALGRRLTHSEAKYIHKLNNVYEQCQYSNSITSWNFAELGLNLPGYSWEPLKIWPAFPQNLRAFWLYVAQAAADRHVRIPEFMRPITQLEEIQKQLSEWKRQQDIVRWEHSLAQTLQYVASPKAKDEVTELRLRVTDKKCCLEFKTASMPDFKPVNSRQARQFLDSYQYDTLALAPAAEPLWQMFVPRIQYGNGTDLAPHDPEANKIVGRILRRPALEDRVVNAAGELFTRAPEPIKWSLLEPDEAQADYHLRLVQADGSSLPPMSLVIDGKPSLFVGQKSIFTGPALERPTLDSLRDNVIPAPAMETPVGVQFLERLGVELPPRLRDRIRRLPMKVTLTAGLKTPNPRDPNEYCVVEAVAASADGSRVEKWDGYSWIPMKAASSAKPPETEQNVLTFYDRAPLFEIPGLLEPLQLLPDNQLRGLAVRISKKFPEMFAAWLKTVPAHLEVRLLGDLASLAKDMVSGRIRLDVTETEIDWFDLQVVVDVSDTELTAEEIRLLLNAKGSFVRLEGKGWRRMAFELTGEDDERLARLGLNPRELTAEPQRLHALQLADESAKKFLPAEQAEHIQRRSEEIKARVTPPLPPELQAELRPYQLEGFHFLAYLSANRFGGILADDMGLGKTLQALAWLLWLRAQPESAARPILVVCPKSVMDNWRAEAERFAPGLRVKTWASAELDQLPTRTAEADAHVLNYSQLRMLGETMVSINWLAIILDEGQYIKNPASQTAQVARALRASHRLILSGTPIENRLTDLWSLMAFAMPGILGSRHSFGKIFDSKHDPLARRRLAARVRPFLIRRSKAQVAKDLPDKIEEDLFCEIEGEQKTLYRAELKFAQQLLLKIKTQKQLAKQQFNFLASLLRLRQICCHPALVKPGSTAESAKVNALLEQLEPLLEQGEKVLVFSQFVELLELLKPQLTKQGWPLYCLTGATENRGDLVHKFQTAKGAAVFLISLKAGGFGLNLTAANYVVLFDPWWNPAVENQAIDRTHRIGQENKVIAYRLLIKGSIEEKIRALQRQKSALAEDVLGEEKFAQSLTMDDLKFLFEDS